MPPVPWPVPPRGAGRAWWLATRRAGGTACTVRSSCPATRPPIRRCRPGQPQRHPPPPPRAQRRGALRQPRWRAGGAGPHSPAARAGGRGGRRRWKGWGSRPPARPRASAAAPPQVPTRLSQRSESTPDATRTAAPQPPPPWPAVDERLSLTVPAAAPGVPAAPLQASREPDAMPKARAPGHNAPSLSVPPIRWGRGPVAGAAAVICEQALPRGWRWRLWRPGTGMQATMAGLERVAGAGAKAGVPSKRAAGKTGEERRGAPGRRQDASGAPTDLGRPGEGPPRR
jgi:hypothetical protein